jgi:hypothetical protein
MVTSGSGWGIGWMGKRQEWPITAPFLDRRSRRGRLGRELLAIAWLTALREETEKARGLHALYCILFWCPGACSDGMAVVSGKWDVGRDWRTGSIVVQRLLAGRAI